MCWLPRQRVFLFKTSDWSFRWLKTYWTSDLIQKKPCPVHCWRIYAVQPPFMSSVPDSARSCCKHGRLPAQQTLPINGRSGGLRYGFWRPIFRTEVAGLWVLAMNLMKAAKYWAILQIFTHILVYSMIKLDIFSGSLIFSWQAFGLHQHIPHSSMAYHGLAVIP